MHVTLYLTIWTVVLVFLVQHSYSSSSSSTEESEELVGYAGPEHALNHELFMALKACDADRESCVPNVDNITSLCARIANEHAALLLYDRALDIYGDILYFMQSDHLIGKRAAHILSVLSFAQGRTVQVRIVYTFTRKDASYNLHYFCFSITYRLSSIGLHSPEQICQRRDR